MLTASSRRIDKCPTPGQRFSENLPTARPTRLQMDDKIKCPRGGVGGMDTLGFTEANN